MLRYRLDDLGWLQFEQLIQGVLKAAVSLAVEAWAGHGDRGRDAYSRQPLRFPDPSVPSEGPFVFQAKFVQEANATGSKWRPSLLAAVSAERVRIGERMAAGEWEAPRHYVLVTNCPITTTARDECMKIIKEVIVDGAITIHGCHDICATLDAHPQLRRAYPELLGLRDLDALLQECVHGDILRRSQAAVDESRDLIPVFVPTSAFYEASRVLNQHHFVVLDGPPEMGKTAIARTIAFGRLMEGCQVIECRSPDDFFMSYDREAIQLFVADDAFGRTEYDPTRGRAWEADLPRILHKVDKSHCLIWTSRRHILTRAIKQMDLTGKASTFPDPGEVVVAADRLTVEEKARMLYRHSKWARLRPYQAKIVRDFAGMIVRSEHFTPERIRRLAREVLPSLPVSGLFGPGRMAVAAEIRDAIQNPTERMRKSLRRLEARHLVVLTLILDSEDSCTATELRERFASHIGTTLPAAFGDALDDLMGTFLRQSTSLLDGQERIQWIHPSYRDLIIDELSENRELQVAFVGNATLHGVKLALSTSGGAEGKRVFPLLECAEAWAALKRRCAVLCRESSDTIWALLLTLAHSSVVEGLSADRREQVMALKLSIARIAAEFLRKLAEPIAASRLRLLGASVLDNADVAWPDVRATWTYLCAGVDEVVATGGRNAQVAEEWASFVDVVEEYYPSFASEPDFIEERSRLTAALYALGERHAEEADEDMVGWTARHQYGNELQSLSDGLARLVPDGPGDGVVARLAEVAGALLRDGSDEEDYDGDRDDDARPPSEEFSIDSLFSDL
jgi:hypothetical protein